MMREKYEEGWYRRLPGTGQHLWLLLTDWSYKSPQSPGLLRESAVTIADKISQSSDYVHDGLIALEAAKLIDVDQGERLIRVPYFTLHLPRKVVEWEFHKWIREWHFVGRCPVRDRHLPDLCAAAFEADWYEETFEQFLAPLFAELDLSDVMQHDLAAGTLMRGTGFYQQRFDVIQHAADYLGINLGTLPLEAGSEGGPKGKTALPEEKPKGKTAVHANETYGPECPKDAERHSFSLKCGLSTSPETKIPPAFREGNREPPSLYLASRGGSRGGKAPPETRGGAGARALGPGAGAAGPGEPLRAPLRPPKAEPSPGMGGTPLHRRTEAPRGPQSEMQSDLSPRQAVELAEELAALLLERVRMYDPKRAQPPPQQWKRRWVNPLRLLLVKGDRKAGEPPPGPTLLRRVIEFIHGPAPHFLAQHARNAEQFRAQWSAAKAAYLVEHARKGAAAPSSGRRPAARQGQPHGQNGQPDTLDKIPDIGIDEKIAMVRSWTAKKESEQ
jgi:hypothetical protein